MSHGPEHHIEHAEHAAHAVHDDFNKRVTMSIAIVAAVLACVTMLGHRAHNETLLVQGEVLHLQGDALRFQGEALQLQTMASIESTNAANKWAYYQSKNLFNLESKIMVDLLKVIAPSEGSQEDLKKLRGEYQKNVDKYDKKLPEIQTEAETLVKKSEKFMEQSQEKMKEYQQRMADSAKKESYVHEVHEKANRFDYGELGLQFGVVLCSLAILTRSRGFWLAGLLSAAVGAVIALTGLLGLFIAHH